MIQLFFAGLLIGTSPQIEWQKILDDQFLEKAHGAILSDDGDSANPEHIYIIVLEEIPDSLLENMSDTLATTN